MSIQRLITTRITKTNFIFNMNKHCTDPEELALHGIAEWIEENSQDISHWLTNGPLWVILNAIGYKVARINSTHPLWQYLDYESQYKELVGTKKNYLIWWGKIKDKEPIEVNHFGPFGLEKIYNEGFDDRFGKFEKIFWAGLNNINMGNYDDLADDERRTILHFEYFEFIRPLLEKHISELVDQRARLVGDNNMTVNDYTKILIKYFGPLNAQIIIKDVVSKRAKSGLAKKIPIGGYFAGIGLGLYRAWHGDVGGCVLELTSGLLSTVPGIGTVASGLVDLSLLLLDINGRVNTELENQITEKKKHLNVIKDAMVKNKSYRYEDLFKAVESFFVA